MQELHLYFAQGDSPQLERSEFAHPSLAAKCCCTRGLGKTAFKNFSTFKWSRAVHALCLLVLQEKAGESRQGFFGLRGGPKTAASSLDYAISKQPLWLADMFGMTENGRLLARRLVNRSNPNRKSPGPVSLSLNTNFLPLSSIYIYLNETLVSGQGSLQTFAEQLEQAFSPNTGKSGSVFLCGIENPQSTPVALPADTSDSSETVSGYPYNC